MKIDLCKPCFEAMKDKPKLIKGGHDNKVTCSKCGKRRYGATYEKASSL